MYMCTTLHPNHSNTHKTLEKQCRMQWRVRSTIRCQVSGRGPNCMTFADADVTSQC